MQRQIDPIFMEDRPVPTPQPQPKPQPVNQPKPQPGERPRPKPTSQPKPGMKESLGKYLLLGCLSFLSLIPTTQAQNTTKNTDTTHHVIVCYDFISRQDPLMIKRWKNLSQRLRQSHRYLGDTSGYQDVRKIYFGDKVNFKIKVNPFLYDVFVDGEDVFDDQKFDTTGQSILINYLKPGTNSTTSPGEPEI